MSDSDTLQPNEEPGDGGSIKPEPSGPSPEAQPSAGPSPYDSGIQQEQPTAAQQPTPAPEAQPEMMLPSGKPGRSMPRIGIPNPRMLMIIAVAIILVAAIGFTAIQLMHRPASSSTTTIVSSAPSTVPTTSVPQINVANINNCTTISKPGTYFLTRNVNTSIAKGPCILVTSSNVKLVGNGNSVTGSGPYSGVGPYTFGIFLDRVSNVTVSGFRILRFDYDVYLNRSINSTVSFNNLTKPTISGVYLGSSVNDMILSNYVTQSDSVQGGITLSPGSNNNQVVNNTVSDNAYSGITINSTGNKFSQNRLLRNPADLVCGANAAMRQNNAFSNSVCSLNDYCEFAQCTTNLPYNISAISLTQGSVRSCGQIYYPGKYVLAANLSTSLYLNTSRPSERKQACITITAPNVNLTCAGRTISGSGYGIYVASTYNSTISNCALANDTYGLYSKGTFGSYVSNINVSRSTYGLYFQNATSGTVSNITMANNTYGIYLNLTNGVSFSRLAASGNKYGVYAASGGSDVFRGGALVNNSKADLYCTAATYNSSANLVQNLACGVTDCSWQGTSACKQHTLPSLLSYPLSACQAITMPGNYSLNQGLLAKGTCFNIQASNVILNCNGHNLLGSSVGSAFAFSNRTNVTILDCIINQFGTGVNASGSSNIGLRSLSISNMTQGVRLSKVSLANVANVTLTQYYMTGFNFSGVTNSVITQNRATGGANGASGFVFANGTSDQVAFNNAGPNPGYGFKLSGFTGDSFYNNSAFDNVGTDYYCSPSTSGYYSDPLGINFGLTGSTCRWLIEVPSLSANPQCQAVSSSAGDISLTQDMLYPYGNTCFSVYTSGQSSGNSTIINCNGHTVYASRGGTFASITNSSSVTVENCYLSNFTTAISATAPYADIVNDTIFNSGTALTISRSRFTKVSGDRMQNDTYGIVAANTTYADILNNQFYATGNAITVSGGSGATVTNNTATLGAYGIQMLNTTFAMVQSNLAQSMSVSGMYCTGASAGNKGQNRDFGGNQCSSNRNCTWMTSPLCLPH
jgi:parallel beta-helix repeat protein